MKDKSPIVSAEIERAVRGEITVEQAAEAVVDIIESYVHEQDRQAELARNADKLAAIGEMVAGVAHELNNPLTGISTFSQLLLEEKLTDEQLQSIGLIKREADRAVGIIRDLLIFARKTGPREVDVDLNSILQHSIRLRSHSAKAKGIEVHMRLDPSLPVIRGDDQKLQQVILHLLVNAESAMKNSSVKHMTITSRAENGAAAISISDTGAGMPPDIRDRIFEPFFTTKTSSSGAGVGLGLSVSYGIIQAHGGTITVESTPGTGSTLTITIPAQSSLGLNNTSGTAGVVA